MLSFCQKKDVAERNWEILQKQSVKFVQNDGKNRMVIRRTPWYNVAKGVPKVAYSMRTLSFVVQRGPLRG